MSFDSGGYSVQTLPGGWAVGQFAALARIPGLAHAVTTRQGLDVHAVHADPGEAARAVVKCLNLDGVAFNRQTHGGVVNVAAGEGLVGDGDALICRTPGLGVMGFSADCPLILVCDAGRGAVGVAHASWRSTVRRIAPSMIQRMGQLWGLCPEDLVACVCPSAGPCCYEVGDEVRQAAVEALGEQAGRFFTPRASKLMFDLWEANRHELRRSGLRDENIHISRVCTICNNATYPSYRREGAAAGRFVAVIGLR